MTDAKTHDIIHSSDMIWVDLQSIPLYIFTIIMPETNAVLDYAEKDANYKDNHLIWLAMLITKLCSTQKLENGSEKTRLLNTIAGLKTH